MRLPRLVFGETSRERELRALVEGLQAERERKDRRIAADREVHDRAIAALRDSLEKALAERDAVRVNRDAVYRLLLAAEAERDEARADAREARQTISDVAANLRCIWEAVEPDDSQEDCPATDSGADGAGTTPE